MNNYRIVIDPGHGGEDPGASGNGIIEKNLTLDISKYMYDRFKELGIPVYITRTTDETISPTERVIPFFFKFKLPPVKTISTASAIEEVPS